MDEIIKNLSQKIQSALTNLGQEMSGIRSNRPTAALVEDLKISYFDQEVPIKQLGSISIMPPRDLVITLWDKSSVEQVAKAIQETKRGYTPNIQGGSIYITLPPLSEERRNELIKIAKSTAEKFRIQIRNARDEANKALAAAELSEDQKFNSKKKVQEATDKGNKEIEAIIGNKVTEISD